MSHIDLLEVVRRGSETQLQVGEKKSREKGYSVSALHQIYHLYFHTIINRYRVI